jgi:hypothetical protein
MASNSSIDDDRKDDSSEKFDTPREEPFMRRLSVAEGEALSVIRSDLAEWLKELLNIDITSETFLSVLDNGVYLCQLAHLIQQQAKSFKKEGRDLPFEVPTKKVNCFKSAAKESFYARDNASNFISWCKDLGLEDTLMFESDGLVMHKSEKEVILCLMEVARKAAKLDLPVPNLIRLEIEMDRESIASFEDTETFSNEGRREFQTDPKKGSTDSPGEEDKLVESTMNKPDTSKSLDSAVSNNGVSDQPTKDDPRSTRESSSSSDHSPPRKKVRRYLSQTDQDVLHLCHECKCEEKLSVKCLRSGKFEIVVHNKRIVIFVRVLKETIMVRVGGGWDTLNHFLLKHDPCRIVLLNHSKDVKSTVLKHMKGDKAV